ncbi:MAG: acetate--CoA ligase family protein [Burkholderiales bacterium]
MIEFDFAALLSPRSIAIVGASDNPHKIGGRPIHFMQRFGFSGKLYPVNPTRSQVQGLKSYPSLAALPESPDCVLLAVGGEAALQAVRDAAKIGAKSLIVSASGFGETGAAGRAMQDEMVRIAHSTGMRMIGPNSQGLANFSCGAVTSFSTLFLERPPADGPVAIVSQSGALSVVPYALLRERGIGVRHVHATGNEADICVAELANAVIADEGVKLLLLYLENFNRPDVLALAAEQARERDIPILALKAGRTQSGAKMASSHTGAMATEDRIVDAFMAKHCILRARNVGDLVDSAELFLSGRRPRGRRLVMLSNSGASCVMAADAADDLNLPLAQLQTSTRDQLKAMLPGFSTAANPIDLTASLLTDSSLFGKALSVIGADNEVDMVMAAIPVAGQGYDVPSYARAAALFIEQTGKPLVFASPLAEVVSEFKKQGVPSFADEQVAMESLAHLANRSGRRSAPSVPLQAVVPVTPVPIASQRYLSEAASLSWLAENGITTVPFRVCKNAAEIRSAFATLGTPVAIKASSHDVPHKSEHGLVFLNITEETSAAVCFSVIESRLAELNAANEGVIVAKMIKPQRELMIGGRIDPQFGPVVMVGDGGKYVEALRDFALLLPPFNFEDVLRALDGLRIAPILHGTRGEPPLDMHDFADMAVRIGEILTATKDRVASIDLNPVMVLWKNLDEMQTAFAADGLVELNR